MYNIISLEDGAVFGVSVVESEICTAEDGKLSSSRCSSRCIRSRELMAGVELLGSW